MFPTTRWMIAVSAGLLAAGCDLHDGNKNACNVQADCLSGFMCTNQLCVADGSGSGSDAGGILDVSSFEYGSVEPMTPATSGLRVIGFDALIGATAATGSLGCAIVQDQDASPGAATSMVHAIIASGQSGSAADRRCPHGSHPVLDDAGNCSFFSQYAGCAVYKKWDASGRQIANRLAIGGHVSVDQLPQSSTDYLCNIELNATFPGPVTIRSTLSYHYDPTDSFSETFCSH